MGCSRQEYWSGLPFPSPIDCVLSELSTMPHLSWVAHHGMAHSFIELNKAMVHSVQFSSVTQLCTTPCDPTNCSTPGLPVPHQLPSLLKLMSIELLMPSNHLILCHPLLLPSIFPSIRIFSNESALWIKWPKYWSFSFNIRPWNEHSICQQVWKTQQWPQDWKRSVFIPIP